MSTAKKTRFSRRVPDHVTDELIMILKDGELVHFNDICERLFNSLKKRNAAGGGEEMLRLRAYEKLQGLVSRGVVDKKGKDYRGLPRLADLLVVESEDDEEKD